jgi:hypothetical protein
MALINTTTTGVLGSTFFGDGTGSLTIQQNGVTLGTYGNIPAFYAYATSAQAFTSGSYIKVLFDTELYDTNNNFASSRFTPTVAGYYQLTAGFQMAITTNISPVIYKNGGTLLIYGTSTPTASYALSNMTVLMYLNGTTDYAEFFVATGTGNTSPSTSSSQTVYFSGILLKAA